MHMKHVFLVNSFSLKTRTEQIIITPILILFFLIEKYQIKEKSAREKCRLLCDKYARPYYGEYDTRTIVNSAYSIRSAYSHGNEKTDCIICSALYESWHVC